MKTYGGVKTQLHILLTSSLLGTEWLASRPDRFTPEEMGPGNHWIGGSVGFESASLLKA